MSNCFFKPVLISGIIISALALGACNKQSKSPFKTEIQKVSYSIGYNLGGSFKSQNINIDQSIFTQGLQSGLSDGKPVMSKEEMQDTLTNFQKDLVAKEVKVMNELADKNEKASAAFMGNIDKESKKANSKIKKIEDGLYYEVITQGAGIKPLPANTVKVNYEGSLIDGKVFDSSYERKKPITFKLSEVIPGWTKALTNMPTGSTWKLYIAPKLAYGKMAPPAIGPNQALIFKVELLSVENK